MTHVRAVRQIIRTELADEKLIEKSGFVRRAPGRVEDRFVGRGERSQLFSDQLERRLPRNGFVMGRPWPNDDWHGQTSLRVQPEIIFHCKIRDRMLRKKLGRYAFCSSLIRESLRTAFAKFCEGPLRIGIRPSTRLAIDPAL